MPKIFILLLCLFLCFDGLKCFDNDTVITIEPRYFFKELIQIWLLYFFKSKPIENVVDSLNVSDFNGSRAVKGTLKNVSTGLDASEDESGGGSGNRVFPCLLNRVNYWNYKSGSVKIPVVLQIDKPTSDKDVSGSQTVPAVNGSDSSQASGNNKRQEQPPSRQPRQRKKCTFIFIYAKWCRFSMAAAPVFNALGRIYPQLEFIGLAINDFQEFKWNLHTSYVPRLKLYFGNKAVREFNGSDDVLESLVEFVFANTGQLPYLAPVAITDDLAGPISSTIEPSGNFWLIISWILTLLSGVYLIMNTTRGRHAVTLAMRYIK